MPEPLQNLLGFLFFSVILGLLPLALTLLIGKWMRAEVTVRDVLKMGHLYFFSVCASATTLHLVLCSLSSHTHSLYHSALSIILGGILVLNITFAASAFGFAMTCQLKAPVQKIHPDFGQASIVTAIVALVAGCVGNLTM
ncbi:hypothetical protein OPIT5_28480 [Opitutaceae bacterium TAV5]|nr:hypothetical protein OPIT5_28480 [Opitutaceae bacterium TAV5]